MSLIYKALEKAQKENTKDETPRPAPVQTQPLREEPLITVPSRVPRIPPAAVISLAGVIFCAIYFYLHPHAVTSFFAGRQAKETAPTAPAIPGTFPAQEVKKTAETPPAAVSAAPAPDVYAPVTEAQTQPLVQEEARTAEAVRPAAHGVPPDIKISGIISDEKSALAIINGKVMSEGEAVTGGVHIKKIYKDSVVVESNGNEFIIKK